MNNKFKCPSLFAHILKVNFETAQIKNSVQNLGTYGMKMSNLEVFSPFGLVCETWRELTNKGKWVGNSFQCEIKTNVYIFAQNYIPEVVVSDFCAWNFKSPLLSLLRYGNNSVENFKQVLDNMEEFEPDFSGLETKNWQLSLVHENL